MWQDDSEVRWKKSTSAFKEPSAHPDYEHNLKNAQTFIRNVTPNLLVGMRVYISSSQWLKDALLTVAWTPPPDVKMGKFAASINLHEPRQEVSKKIESVFNNYMNMAKKNNGS